MPQREGFLKKAWTARDVRKRTHDVVISLVSRWSMRTWHAVMEALVSLGVVDLMLGGQLHKHSSKIHIARRSTFTDAWLSLAGIEPKRIIDRQTILARELLVPEMGRCSNPAPHQVSWLRGKVRAKVVPQIAQQPSQEKGVVLLVKRSGDLHISRNAQRIILNFDKVEEAVGAYAKAKGMRLDIFDDSHLGPVSQQLKRFSVASLVVAPHGAGLLNLVAVRAGTTVVEMFAPGWVVLCFSRLAFLLGLNYYGLALNGTKNHPCRADISHLSSVLHALPNIGVQQ